MPRLLSLDIREDVICGVLLSVTGKSVSVLNCGISVPGEKTHSEAIVEVLSQVGYDGETCRISFGAENFFYRNLSFPFSDKRKIEKILAIELEDSVIVDMDNLLVDSLITGQKGAESAVVAAMIDRQLLRRHMDELAELDLDPEIVTISHAQTALQLAKRQENHDFVLLDASCCRVTIFVMAGARMRLLRTIVFDDTSFAHFGIDENSQQVAPKRPEKKVHSFTAMCREIRHTLYALEDVDPGLPIYLTGALARVPEIDSFLRENLECEVLPCNLLDENTKVGLECGLWRDDLMTSALALGMRSDKRHSGFNFRKQEFARKVSYDRYRRILPRLGIPVAVCCVIAFIYFWNDFNLKEKELNRLRLEAEDIFKQTMPEVTRIVDPVQQLSVAIREMNKGMLGEVRTGSDVKVLDIMAEISARIPQSTNIHVIRLVSDQNGILLRGLTDNFNSVDNIKKFLEKSDYFDAVTINSANLSQRDSGIRFELKIELNRG